MRLIGRVKHLISAWRRAPRRLRLLVGVAALSVSVAPASVDAQEPQFPQKAPIANVCTTNSGWCPLQAQRPIASGTPCQCFVPPNTVLSGIAIFWPYQHPVSPYLNPHERYR
jgi:hypothetical protein